MNIVPFSEHRERMCQPSVETSLVDSCSFVAGCAMNSTHTHTAVLQAARRTVCDMHQAESVPALPT